MRHSDVCVSDYSQIFIGHIFNFTKFKKLLDEEIKGDIKKYEEKVARKEEKKL